MPFAQIGWLDNLDAAGNAVEQWSELVGMDATGRIIIRQMTA